MGWDEEYLVSELIFYIHVLHSFSLIVYFIKLSPCLCYIIVLTLKNVLIQHYRVFLPYSSMSYWIVCVYIPRVNSIYIILFLWQS